MSWMNDSDDRLSREADLTERFPDPNCWNGEGDIIPAVMADLARAADCAVIMRVLLGAFGYNIVRRALIQSCEDDVSGEAVEVVAKKMGDLLPGGGSVEHPDLRDLVDEAFTIISDTAPGHTVWLDRALDVLTS